MRLQGGKLSKRNEKRSPEIYLLYHGNGKSEGSLLIRKYKLKDLVLVVSHMDKNKSDSYPLKYKK